VSAKRAFFAKHLAMNDCDGANEEDERDPVGKEEELPEEDEHEGKVDGIASGGKDAGGNELVWTVFVDAYAKAVAEGNKAPAKDGKAREAGKFASKHCNRRSKEAPAARRPEAERVGKDRVEIKEHEGWEEKVRFICRPEPEGPNAAPPQHAGTEEDDADEEKKSERAEVSPDQTKVSSGGSGHGAAARKL
jgi:hypothetical protein